MDAAEVYPSQQPDPVQGGGQQWRDHQCRQEVRDLDAFQLEQTKPNGKNRNPAGGGQFSDHDVGEPGVDQEREQGEHALDEEHTAGRKIDAPAERGGKDQRREAVQRRLDREQGDGSPRAVQEGAQHRERSNTKDEAGGDEGQRYPSRLAATMQTALGPGTDRLDAGIETKQLTDDDADENADQQHEWISGSERHLEADDDDEQPDRDPDAALQAVGDHPAEREADGGADDHRSGVERRSQSRDHDSATTL